MISQPARHAIYQRAREVERLSSTPHSLRADEYLNKNVRCVSDDVARIAAFPIGDENLIKGLQKKQRDMSRFRQTMSHLVESVASASTAVAPARRGALHPGE